MHELQGGTYRLKSRYSYMIRTKCITRNSKERIKRWKENIGDKTAWIMQRENLAPGHTNKWVSWRNLNRFQTKVGRCKANLENWGYLEDSLGLCECDEEQTMEHLLKCSKFPITCNNKISQNQTRRL